MLVSVGIHGSMQRYVSQQHRAIGARMAFGADTRRIVGIVVGSCLALAGLGTTMGVLGALALQRLTAGLIYGAFLEAPTRLGPTALAIFALAVVACAAPAYRASRIDPARLLRE